MPSHRRIFCCLLFCSSAVELAGCFGKSVALPPGDGAVEARPSDSVGGGGATASVDAPGSIGDSKSVIEGPSIDADASDGSAYIGGTDVGIGVGGTGGIGSGTGGTASGGSTGSVVTGGSAGSGSDGSAGSGSGGSAGSGGSGGSTSVAGNDAGIGTGGIGSGGTGPGPDAARDVPLSTPDALTPVGGTCTSGTTCTLGICADGYCCDKPCTGSCQACNLPASLGTCTTLAQTSQPRANHAACVATDATCGGRCNGTSGDCFYPPTTTACGTASCTSGVYQAAGTCNGGACGLPNAKTCSNLCVTTAGCVDCTTSSQCTDPTKPICQANLCVSCSAGSSGACGAKDGTKTTCDSGTGKCVACTSSNQCTTAPNPICGNGQNCVACGDSSAPTNGCFAKNGGLAACNPTSGSCVECTANSYCTTSGKPVCNTSTNQCVQCTDNSQCSGATPICSSNTCVACTTDAQCVAKLGSNPGVCMSHQDGRCATDAETIYAEYTVPGCATTIAGGGTAATPYCDAVIALGAVSASRRLIVVRGSVGADISYYTPGLQLTVVGQLNAMLFPAGVSPSCAVVSNGADLYMRDLICNTNYNADAIAAHSATLHLLRMVLFDSAGGLFLDRSNFEIVDTILSNNSSYGISVNNPPATGLKSLQRVTFKDINSTDITCTGPVTGVGVYAPDNKGISSACGITTCSSPSTSCGSSLTWVSPN
jgi:hypothetical protein